MGREHKGSRKASKLSENDIKHHNKKSPSSKITIFESMYMKYISKVESKNWRLTANTHFFTLIQGSIQVWMVDPKKV